jgi:lipopolysaccharide export system protein LptC
MRDRLVSAIAIALLAVVLITSYWYSQSLRAGAQGGAEHPGGIDFFAEHITMTQFDGEGHARYRLFADRMTHYPDSDDVDLVQPRLVSLRPDQPQVRASALSAHVENNAAYVMLQNQVVITRDGVAGQPPMRIETESLLAVPDLDRYSTDDPIRVERGGALIRAHGMDFDNLARRVEFRRDVHARFPPRAQP